MSMDIMLGPESKPSRGRQEEPCRLHFAVTIRYLAAALLLTMLAGTPCKAKGVGMVEVWGSRLNVRQSPNVSSPVITVLERGQHILAEPTSSRDWIKVKLNGKWGYVSSGYVQWLDRPREEGRQVYKDSNRASVSEQNDLQPFPARSGKPPMTMRALPKVASPDTPSIRRACDATTANVALGIVDVQFDCETNLEGAAYSSCTTHYHISLENDCDAPLTANVECEAVVGYETRPRGQQEQARLRQAALVPLHLGKVRYELDVVWAPFGLNETVIQAGLNDGVCRIISLHDGTAEREGEMARRLR